MRHLASLCLALAVIFGSVSNGASHALDPGYLNLQPLSGDSWRAFWRKPTVGATPMQIEARLPEQCTPATAPPPRFDGKAWVSQWVATCTGGLSGGRIAIEGLEATRTDVLVRIENPGSQVVTTRLTPDRTGFDIPQNPSVAEVFKSYLALGFDHILEGWDHLLFVFALLVLIQSPGRLVGAITAFTVAHSITLAAASLGVVSVPGPPVEAAIALSIVLLAVEILRRGDGKPHLTATYPWVVAFLFGLLHGFGFAGALSEIGLPDGDIPLALLAFNLGVEAGQLTFVAGVLALFFVLRQIGPQVVETLRAPRAVGTQVMGYAIGVVSVYWLAERVASF